jgi:hypothetical protein
MASSSRSQVAARAASAAARVACGRSSVRVRWRPPLSVAIVTQFVTRSLAGIQTGASSLAHRCGCGPHWSMLRPNEAGSSLLLAKLGGFVDPVPPAALVDEGEGGAVRAPSSSAARKMLAHSAPAASACNSPEISLTLASGTATRVCKRYAERV